MKLGVCTLDQIAKVSLGFKSLQNQFFYVSKETIAKFGIEKPYLKSIFQLGDLQADKYKQTKKATLKVFYCREKEADLRGTGALRYIRAMEKLPAAEKKQGGKKQTIREALQAQTSVGGTWYMPKAQLHQMNIWLRKAFNTVYSPFIFDTPAAVDQRCNYVLPLDAIDWKVVGAVLTSSLFAFSAESFGSASMGAGALELPTTMIHGLRVIDVRSLKDREATKDLVTLADKVWTDTRPINWSVEEKPPQEVQDLDAWFLSRMETKVTLDRVYADLAATLKSRLAVADDKDVQTKRGKQLNIGTVANGIAETVRPLLESRSFPESFIENAANTTPLDLSHAGKLEIECHPMMGEAALVIRDGAGVVLAQGQFPRSVAQVIVKALLMGRRKFSHPTEIADAENALKRFSEWFPKILNKIAVGCGLSAVGTSYEDDVYNAVLDTLGLDQHISSPEFYGVISACGPPLLPRL
jgi:hypothetical protein